MREELLKSYNRLIKAYGITPPIDSKHINSIILTTLKDFLKDKKNPAIYCYGGHTKALMSDFMFELKRVKIIIDNYADRDGVSGFKIIRDNEIEENDVDAIILSSYKYRNDLKVNLQTNHPQIPVLDIYDKIHAEGIDLQSDYYYAGHPFQHYHKINTLQRELRQDKVSSSKIFELVSEYIAIKDFRTALCWLEEYKQHTDEDFSDLYADIKYLYELELNAASEINENNILMLCMDGLRYCDVSAEYMPKLCKWIECNTANFTRTYSFSTSTFESLIPVFSQNTDQRTKYYESNEVQADQCSFIKTAMHQQRKICLYTGVDKMISGEGIYHSGSVKTVTENMWDYITDFVDEKNGFAYIHNLYETHFTFSNPYTKEKLITEGTALLFEYLPQKGGRQRTDFRKQRFDALNYIDDVVSPFLDRMKCQLLLFADHGNLVPDKDAGLSDIDSSYLTSNESWTRIPFIIKSEYIDPGKFGQLNSLLVLPEVINDMLECKDINISKRKWVKIGRSEIYNPDFKAIYHMMNCNKYLQAFECFVFDEGYKLFVFTDGTKELRDSDDKLEDNNEKLEDLYQMIRDEITVV